jgi:hypothetical protein
LLGHGPFYTRLGSVLFSAGTIYFGFNLLPRLANVRLYLLIFCSAILFHVYSFIATPDAPLLFFTTLFFYAYRKFLAADTALHIALLAASIAGLLYSKYHGVLPVFFTVLSNPKLLKKRTAWAVILLVAAAVSPHLWWQYEHRWPTLRYHLSERVTGPYEFSNASTYIAGQLFIWGVLTTPPALFLFIKQKNKGSVYERAHRFTFWGVLLFFLFSSFSYTIQLHWTLVAAPSFVVLLQDVLNQASLELKRTFVRLLCANILLILLARLLLVLPIPAVKNLATFKALTNTQPWTDSVYFFAKNLPVVFVDSYRLPALYLYNHPDAKAWGYNTVQYRKTQFNIFSDHFLNNTRVCVADTDPQPGSTLVLKTLYNTIYLRRMNSFKAVNALKIVWCSPVKTASITEKQMATVLLTNTGNDTVATKELSINYSFIENDHTLYTAPDCYSFVEAFLPPHAKKEIRLPLRFPADPQAYHLVFSVVQPTLAGTFASPFYKVVVQ